MVYQRPPVLCCISPALYLLTSSRLLVLLLYLRLGIIISAANSTLLSIFPPCIIISVGSWYSCCISASLLSYRRLTVLCCISASYYSYRRLRYSCCISASLLSYRRLTVLCMSITVSAAGTLGVYQRLRYFVVSPYCVSAN